MTSLLDFDNRKLEELCVRWKVARLDLFGSVLRADFGTKSDVDVLVDFDPEAHWSLLELARMEIELAGVMGRPVDLVERQAVEQGENPVRRKHILAETQNVYVV
jgi:uncharacterized protein